MTEAIVIRGNALSIPLEDESVDCIITSPPYFALRSYQDDTGHYDGQIGSEPTPQDFLEALWAATREMVRVLKPTGSIFVNLGDKYAGSGGHNNSNISGPSGKSTLQSPEYGRRMAEDATRRQAPDHYNKSTSVTPSTGPSEDFKQGARDGHRRSRPAAVNPGDLTKAAGPADDPNRRMLGGNLFNDNPDRDRGTAVDGIRPKSLVGLPWRYALGCLDHLGLILRAEIIWSKPNGLPESVTDRVRRAHEQIFHFTKEGRYYQAIDEIRQPHKYGAAHSPQSITSPSGQGFARRAQQGFHGHTEKYQEGTGRRDDIPQAREPGEDGSAFNPAGRLPGSVWEIPTEPLTVPAYLVDGKDFLNAPEVWQLATIRHGKGVEQMLVEEPIEHFAAFPSELPRRLILGWSPKDICTRCGEGLRPATETSYLKGREELLKKLGPKTAGNTDNRNASNTNRGIQARYAITGYICACNEPIATPRGSRVADDPSLETGRGGLNRPRSGEATRVQTRWEQADYAEQIKNSEHRDEMAAGAGEAIQHYTRTDRSGARAVPPDLLEVWLENGWLTPARPYEPAPTTPGVVLDPFGGTGTTAMVAKSLGRNGISLDLSQAYSRLADWRIHKSKNRNRAHQRTAERAQTRLL